MFTVTEIPAGTHTLQVREEMLTGLRCKISPERLTRGIDSPYTPPVEASGCPFCRDRIFSVTPTFSDGSRICIGESVTFPNLFPFGEWHTVTVVTARHHADTFSRREINDALSGQVQSLIEAPGYKSINWNYLPSAGASIAHPHLQGLVDRRPPVIVERYMQGGIRYLAEHGRTYWEDVRSSEVATDRYLFGEELFWYAQPVPVGEREVRCIFPVSTIEEFPAFIESFARGFLTVISMYQKLGTHAFNMSIFFDRERASNGFSAFCSIISRMNPNTSSMSDSAFMERLHLEPVILTTPEDVGEYYRTGKMG